MSNVDWSNFETNSDRHFQNPVQTINDDNSVLSKDLVLMILSVRLAVLVIKIAGSDHYDDRISS